MPREVYERTSTNSLKNIEPEFDFKANYKSMQERNHDLIEENDDLKNQISSKSDLIEEHESEIEKLKSQIDILKETIWGMVNP